MHPTSHHPYSPGYGRAADLPDCYPKGLSRYEHPICLQRSWILQLALETTKFFSDDIFMEFIKYMSSLAAEYRMSEQLESVR